MVSEIELQFEFPDEFPDVTAGIFISEDDVLVTGHSNGYLVRWDIRTRKYKILHECNSKVETMSKSSTGDILVGCNSGFLFIFSLSSPQYKTILQKHVHNKWSRVWRSLWLDKNNIIITSTYGELRLFNKKNSTWKTVSLQGHSDSVFGIGAQNNKLLATGDYGGRIHVWELKEETYHIVGRLRVHGTVEGISWINDNSFVTIDDFGHINQFELDAEKNQWKSVFEVDVATSVGVSINVTSDEKTIFAVTQTEIIQIDLDTQQFQKTSLKNSKKVFSQKKYNIHSY